MLFDGARPSHIFALMLWELGWRRLDVRDMAGLCKTFYNLRQKNPSFMKSFACMGGRCINMAALIQQFEMDGILTQDECRGVYKIGRASLSARLSQNGPLFGDFPDWDALLPFSLMPIPSLKHIKV